MELFISQDDLAYLQAGIDKAGYSEIGFLGLILEEDGIHVIRHLEILEQEVSSGGVDFDDEGFALYLERRLLNGELPEGKFGIYSAHSHGNMNVFWSSTDEDGISRYLRGAPYIFSSVLNTKGEAKHRMDIGTVGHDCPLVGQITFNDANLRVLSIPEVAVLEAQIDEIQRDLNEAAKEDARRDFEKYVRTSSWSWKKDKSGEIKREATKTPVGFGNGTPSNGQKQLPPASGSSNGNGAATSGNGTASTSTEGDKRLVPDKDVEELDLAQDPHLVDADEEVGQALFWYEKTNEVVRIDFERLSHPMVEGLRLEDKYELKAAISAYNATLAAYAAMTGMGV